MRRLRAEFAGLRPTPLARCLGVAAGGLGLAAVAWAVLVFFIWCAS